MVIIGQIWLSVLDFMCMSEDALRKVILYDRFVLPSNHQELGGEAEF